MRKIRKSQRWYQGRIRAPRRSTPSSKSASASGLSDSLLFVNAAGQLNVPCSNRFTETQHPVPSKQSTLMRAFPKTFRPKPLSLIQKK
jgi:hypothetical protein